MKVKLFIDSASVSKHMVPISSFDLLILVQRSQISQINRKNENEPRILVHIIH